MNHLHNFEDFLYESHRRIFLAESLLQFDKEELDEGFKENVFAGLLSFFIGGSVSSQNIKNVIERTPDSSIVTKTVNFKLGDKMSKEKADMVIRRMLSHGFSITSEKMDTLWKEVKEKAPDTSVRIFSLRFDSDSSFFDSGKFEMSPDTKSDIDKAFQFVQEMDGMVSHVKITSSTDKQGLSTNLQAKLKSMGFAPNNDGLSKARSSNMADYLTDDVGIEKSLIETVNFAEKGAGEIDASARFVRMDITYICCAITPGTGEKDSDSEIDYTVVLRKAMKTPSQPSTPGKFREASGKSFKMKSIKNYVSPSSVECPRW